ncbi:MAG: oligosaccharide flippase family protein [Polyangiales bacterium]
MRPAQHDLRRGFRALGAATTLVRIVDVVAVFVVLRILPNDAIGEASVAWTLATLLEAWNGAGIGPALVQARRVTRADLDSAFTAASLAGLVLFGVAALLGPIAARAYGDPRLVVYLPVTGTKLLALGLAAVPLARLQRALRFEVVASLQVIATLVSAIVRVSVALAGGGAFAIVLAHASHGIATMVGVFVLAPFRPRLRLEATRLWPLFAFGAATSLHDTVYQAYRNVDFLLVGRLLGLSALGVYRVIFDVAMEPLMAISDVLTRTGARVYCRLVGDPPRLAEAVRYTFRTLLRLLGPVALLLILALGAVLDLLGGDRFDEALPAGRLLVVAAFVRALFQLVPAVFTSVGRPGLSVVAATTLLVLLSLGIGVPLALVGERAGLLPVALAWLVAPLVVGLATLRPLRDLGAIASDASTPPPHPSSTGHPELDPASEPSP